MHERDKEHRHYFCVFMHSQLPGVSFSFSISIFSSDIFEKTNKTTVNYKLHTTCNNLIASPMHKLIENDVR